MSITLTPGFVVVPSGPHRLPMDDTTRHTVDRLVFRAGMHGLPFCSIRDDVKGEVMLFVTLPARQPGGSTAPLPSHAALGAAGVPRG